MIFLSNKAVAKNYYESIGVKITQTSKYTIFLSKKKNKLYYVNSLLFFKRKDISVLPSL